jgi:hypothetical protein
LKLKKIKNRAASMNYKLILTSNYFFLTNSEIKHDNYASNSLNSMNFKGMMREGRGGIEFAPHLHDQAPG